MNPCKLQAENVLWTSSWLKYAQASSKDKPWEQAGDHASASVRAEGSFVIPGAWQMGLHRFFQLVSDFALVWPQLCLHFPDIHMAGLTSNAGEISQ